MDSSERPIPAESEKIASAPRVWGPWISVAFGLTVGAVYFLIQVVVIIAFIFGSRANNPTLNVMEVLGNLLRTEEGLVASVSSIISVAVSIPLLMLFVKLRGKTSFAEYVGLRRVNGKALSFWLGITVGFIALSEGISFFIEKPADEFTLHLYLTSVWPPVLWFVLIIVAPVFEETLFRGFLFEGFRQSRVGAIGTIVLMAVSWSLLHVQYRAFDLATVFVGGLLLGTARLKTNSLWTPLLMHALWNLVAVAEISVFVLSSR